VNFKELEAFKAVMTTRSMTAAAGLLHTSQPNISRWIGLLEDRVGFTLFQRSGTRLIPTAEAEVFFADVQRAFVGLESLDESANSIRKRGTGVLRIAAVGSLTMCVLPEAIKIFRRNYGEVSVVVSTGRSDVVAKWTATGFCDIGLCSYPIDISGLKYDLTNTSNGVCVIPRQHPLATKEVLTPEDFADQHFISLAAGSSNREAIDRHFTRDSRILAIETPYGPTICALVNEGLGVSIVSPIVVRAQSYSNICEIPFSQKMQFHSYAVTSEVFPPNLLAQDFSRCVREAFDRVLAS
jgi:DNA-binding transcriptional LysR family regulator